MTFFKTFLSILTFIVFTACGGSSAGSTSSDSTSQSDVITSSDPSFSITNEYTSGFVGKFIDSPVSGLTYHCDTIDRTTDEEGLFNCENLPVTFSLGTIMLGTLDKLQADYLVFPQDILKQPRSAALHPEVTKMAVLLQSVDTDANALNGINIDPDMLKALSQELPQKTDLTDISLEDLNAILQNAIQTTSNVNLRVVSAQQAQDHLLFSISNNYKSPIQP